MLNTNLEVIAFAINEMRAFTGQVMEKGDIADLLENCDRFARLHKGIFEAEQEVLHLVNLHNNVLINERETKAELDAFHNATELAIAEAVIGVRAKADRGVPFEFALWLSMVDAVCATTATIGARRLTKTQVLEVAEALLNEFPTETATPSQGGDVMYLALFRKCSAWVDNYYMKR